MRNAVLLLSAWMWFGMSARVIAQNPEPEQTNDQLASQYFHVAEAAFLDGQFERALSAFKESYALSGRSLLLYNIGATLDRLQRFEEAAEFYERYLSETEDPPQKRIVQSRIRIIRESLAADRPVEEIAQTEAAVAAEEEEEPEPEAEETESEPAIDEPEQPSLLPALITLSVGAAGLVTFGIAGGLAWSRHGELSDSCAPRCDEADSAQVARRSLVADIGLGVGIVGAAVGLVLLLINRRKAEEPLVTPSVSTHGAGLSVSYTM